MKKVAAAIFFAYAMLYAPNGADSCAPVFNELRFVSVESPDQPLVRFYRGDVGIVQPTWFRRYLVIAYRYLSGEPLTVSERESEQYAAEPKDPVKHWLTARTAFTKQLAPKVDHEGYLNDWSAYWENCHSSAFETATATLKSRATEYSSQELQEWIAGQDVVFANCGNEKSAAPSPLPVTARAKARADREYQIAAAYFYANVFDEALPRFDRIGRDNASPWQKIAPYLAARTLIRKATLTPAPATDGSYTFDRNTLVAAEGRLHAILKDPSRTALRRDIQRLLGFTAFRLRPLERQHELARSLVSGKLGSEFGQALTDYTLLLDKFLDAAPPEIAGAESYGPEYDKRAAEWRNARYSELSREREDELTDWIMTIQSHSPAALEHAIAMWQKTQSMPWLAAALGSAKPQTKEISGLLKAAANVESHSAAYATVSYHRVRLLRESGQFDAAREALSEVLTRTEAMPLSAQNLFAKERTLLAPDLDAFISTLPRVPVDFWTEPGEEVQAPYCYQPWCKDAYFEKGADTKYRVRTQLDADAVLLLNGGLPVRDLAEIVRRKQLPAHLQSRLAVATWTRAALLGDFDLAAEVSPFLPAKLQRFTHVVQSSPTEDERHFSTAFAILHFPGMRPFVESKYIRETPLERIDNLRDNWWCIDPTANVMQPDYSEYGRKITWKSKEQVDSVPGWALLSDRQKQESAQELDRLNDISTAESYLAKVVLDWARTHREDPRVPEALHLAIRAVRFSCYEKPANPYARQIFELLHRRYPKSEWAKKTPYWYE